MSRFDSEAEAWDKNEDIQCINERIASLVVPKHFSNTSHVLELGSGTGILTFKCYDQVQHWLAIDSSPGMIARLDEKWSIAPEAARRIIKTQCFMLHSPSQLTQTYDWAISAMTFHHIKDMGSTIICLAGCVTTGLIIVDFLEWPGSSVFHPENKMIGVERHGLRAQELKTLCTEAGFTNVTTEIAFEIELEREGRPINFPFLVVVARK